MSRVVFFSLLILSIFYSTTSFSSDIEEHEVKSLDDSLLVDIIHKIIYNKNTIRSFANSLASRNHKDISKMSTCEKFSHRCVQLAPDLQTLVTAPTGVALGASLGGPLGACVGGILLPKIGNYVLYNHLLKAGSIARIQVMINKVDGPFQLSLMSVEEVFDLVFMHSHIYWGYIGELSKQGKLVYKDGIPVIRPRVLKELKEKFRKSSIDQKTFYSLMAIRELFSENPRIEDVKKTIDVLLSDFEKMSKFRNMFYRNLLVLSKEMKSSLTNDPKKFLVFYGHDIVDDGDVLSPERKTSEKKKTHTRKRSVPKSVTKKVEERAVYRPKEEVKVHSVEEKTTVQKVEEVDLPSLEERRLAKRAKKESKPKVALVEDEEDEEEEEIQEIDPEIQALVDSGQGELVRIGFDPKRQFAYIHYKAFSKYPKSVRDDYISKIKSYDRERAMPSTSRGYNGVKKLYFREGYKVKTSKGLRLMAFEEDAKENVIVFNKLFSHQKAMNIDRKKNK